MRIIKTLCTWNKTQSLGVFMNNNELGIHLPTCTHAGLSENGHYLMHEADKISQISSKAEAFNEIR